MGQFCQEKTLPHELQANIMKQTKSKDTSYSEHCDWQDRADAVE